MTGTHSVAEVIGGGLTQLRTPQFDPAYGRLLHLRVDSDPTWHSTSGSVWSTALDGSGPTRLSPAGDNVGTFSVAPSGGRLAAIVANSRQEPRLVVTPSSEWSPVAEVPLPGRLDGRPAWSRSGDHLAASLLTPDRGEADPETSAAHAYKEDGVGFVGAARRQLWLFDVAAATWSRLTDEAAHCSDPQWSPAEDVVAFRRQDPQSWPLARLAEIAPGSSSCRVHVTPEMTIDAFSWSPDGSRLLLIGDDVVPWSSHLDLFLLDRERQQVERLTDGAVWQPWVHGFHVSPSAPAWRSADVLLLPSVRHGRSLLVELTVSTRVERIVADWRDLRGGSAWTPGHDVLVQERSSLDGVGELVAHDLTTGSDRTVAAPNADRPLGRPAHVVRSAVPRAGGDVDLWVLLPPGHHDDAACPLVLDVHGGPHNFYGEFFIPEQHALLSAGVAVAFANPRGSASYGREFGAATHGAWGTEDTEDLWAVLEVATALPGIDAEAVGVMGWSYGGYQVAWMLAHSDRFRAAACGAPAFDLASWVGTSDRGPSFARHDLGGLPYERPALYRGQSPSTHAHLIRTPTLILHGGDDLRSPLGQTETMFQALTSQGVRAEYVRYPGGSHGFRHTGSPRQRADVVRRITEWFARELTEGGTA